MKNGVDISQTPPHELVDHRIAVVLENRRLFGELTVRENLLLADKAGARNGDRKVFDWADIYALFPMIEERLRRRRSTFSAAASSRWSRSRARCCCSRIC